MPDFDPEGLSRSDIPLIEPSSIHWPRLLALWRGLIQPQRLLSSIRDFPTSVRLTGLSTLPSLAMQVARRLNGFVNERLPFLAARGPVEQTGEMPQYEYRMQRRTRRAPFSAPFDWSAHSVGEPLPGNLQLEPIAHMGEPANEELEEYPENTFESFLPSLTQPLAHEMAWALPSPHTQVAPAIEPVYLEADAWRESMHALQELPRAVQPIGLEGEVIRIAPHPTMIHELVRETAERTNLSEPAFEPAATHTEGQDLTGQVLARQGIPNLVVAQGPARAFQSATAVYRQLQLASARGRELPANERPAAPENTSLERWPLIHGPEERATEIEANAAAVLRTIDYRTLAPSLPLAGQGTMLGEVLTRHEGVLPNLLQVELQQSGIQAASSALERGALDTTSVLSPTRLAEPIWGMSFRSAVTRTIHSPLEPSGVISRLPGAISQGETRLEREAFPLGTVIPAAELGAAPFSHLSELTQTSELSRLQQWMEPGRLEAQVRRELPAISASERLNAVGAAAEAAPLQILRHLSPVQAGPAMAALGALPAIAAGERLTEPVRPAMGTLLGQGLASVQAYSSAAAETLGATISTGERTMLAPARMEFAGLHGPASLGQEITHLGQPLGSGPLAEPLSGSWAAAEVHAARQQQPVVEHHSDQGLVPQMELRREAQAHPTQAHGSPGGPMMTQWSGGTNAQEIEGAPMPGPVFAEPAVAPTEPAGASEAGWSGAAPAPGMEESLIASPNLAALARQVYAILKNELRAERDRHQLYNR